MLCVLSFRMRVTAKNYDAVSQLSYEKPVMIMLYDGSNYSSLTKEVFNIVADKFIDDSSVVIADMDCNTRLTLCEKEINFRKFPYFLELIKNISNIIDIDMDTSSIISKIQTIKSKQNLFSKYKDSIHTRSQQSKSNYNYKPLEYKIENVTDSKIKAEMHIAKLKESRRISDDRVNQERKISLIQLTIIFFVLVSITFDLLRSRKSMQKNE